MLSLFGGFTLWPLWLGGGCSLGAENTARVESVLLAAARFRCLGERVGTTYPFYAPGRCRIHWSNNVATQRAGPQAPGLGDGHTRQMWVPGGCLPARSRGAQGAPSPRWRPPKVRGEPAQITQKRAQMAQKWVLGPF